MAGSIGYTLGWRMQSEILTLRLSQVDLEAGTLRLNPGQTKNGDGRVAYMPPDLKAAVAAQVERVRSLGRETGQIIPHLFPHLDAGFKGDRRRDFRWAWESACKAAGVPGMLRHDLRRTAVRNLVRAGVVQTVAMKVTGHTTDAVFRRYDIVSEADLRDAARKLAGTQMGTQMGFGLNGGRLNVENHADRPGSSTGRASAF